MKKRKWHLMTAWLFALGLLVYSAWNIYGILSEYRLGERAYEAMATKYVRIDLDSGGFGGRSVGKQSIWKKRYEIRTLAQKTPAIQSDTGGGSMIPDSRAFPVKADASALCEAYSDAVGWLFCADTPINYPVMQGKDNSYYLRRLPGGISNHSGSLFLDCRNNPDFSDRTSILYGHNMKNGSMFGCLTKYRSQSYFEEHPIWYLFTPERTYRIRLFGGCTVSGTDDTIFRIPGTDEDRDKQIDRILSLTDFHAETGPGSDERLIFFCTCAYEFEDARYVLAGFLENQES